MFAKTRTFFWKGEIEKKKMIGGDEDESLDLISNPSSSEEEDSLQRAFNRNFVTLREIYTRLTGGQGIPEPESFSESTTVTSKGGHEVKVYSSVPFDELKTSEEGDVRGIYVVSDRSIRYFLYLNKGSDPTEINSFSLRVVRPQDDADREVWSEIKIATMPNFIAEKLFSRGPGMRTAEQQRSNRGNRGMSTSRQQEDESSNNSDEEVSVTQSANDSAERSDTEVSEDE